MKFGENLYNLRKSSKMSQEVLAEKIGVSRQSVSKWENSESYPEMDKIIKLCDIFHCKINDLVHEDLVDIDSLDEEIKMSVVKFKKEKQKKMKALSKVIYYIAKVGKIVTAIGVPILLITMFITLYFVSNITIDNNKISFGNLIQENEQLELVEKNEDNHLAIKFDGEEIDIEKELEKEFDEDIPLYFREYSKELVSNTVKALEKNNKSQTITKITTVFIAGISSLVLTVLTLRNLEKLFKNINNGDTPFTLENVRHIKLMAYFMIGSIVLNFINNQIMKVSEGIAIYKIVEILFLFGIAYIFEYGYEIQLDSKGKMYGEEGEDNEEN